MTGGYERCRLHDQEQIRMGRNLCVWVSPAKSYPTPPPPPPPPYGVGCVAWLALNKGTSKVTFCKEMATHSSVLAWRIPGTEEPGGLPSLGSHRVRHDWSNLALSSVCKQCCAEGPGMQQGKVCTRPALMGQAQYAQWWLLWVCKTAHSSLKLS